MALQVAILNLANDSNQDMSWSDRVVKGTHVAVIQSYLSQQYLLTSLRTHPLVLKQTAATHLAAMLVDGCVYCPGLDTRLDGSVNNRALTVFVIRPQQSDSP